MLKKCLIVIFVCFKGPQGKTGPPGPTGLPGGRVSGFVLFCSVFCLFVSLSSGFIYLSFFFFDCKKITCISVKFSKVFSRFYYPDIYFP